MGIPFPIPEILEHFAAFIKPDVVLITDHPSLSP
jgi:hypothetical protein